MPTVTLAVSANVAGLIDADHSLMQKPSEASAQAIYGGSDALSSIKMVTLAPELEGSKGCIESLTKHHSIAVSLGHSAADYDTGQQALRAGAKALTHVFNAMSPLHHREPGLAGLIASPERPYYSVIADGIHLHPATLSMAYRSDPARCILISDAIEMAGMPDGVYPPHAQIPHLQRKAGNKVTVDGTDTLIGSCCSVGECVVNLKLWSGCSLVEAAACASENIAKFMGLDQRGSLQPGKRADFVVLNSHGDVLQTWVSGRKVYERGG